MNNEIIKAAREALDSLDDCARMESGVDAIGPRGVLEAFITLAERASNPASPAPVAAITELPAELNTLLNRFHAALSNEIVYGESETASTKRCREYEAKTEAARNALEDAILAALAAAPRAQAEQRKRTIPTWEEAQECVDAQCASALDIFVYANEPAGDSDETHFRAQLQAVIDEVLAAPAAPVAPSEQEPDMLWWAYDEEEYAESAEEFAKNYASNALRVGETEDVQVYCAHRATPHKRTLRIGLVAGEAEESDRVEWKWIDAAAPAAPVAPSEQDGAVISSYDLEKVKALKVQFVDSLIHSGIQYRTCGAISTALNQIIDRSEAAAPAAQDKGDA